ncbi:MAG TPA: stage II sporulation protein M [Methanoregulaceae archaeon]|nr:stage II sporulation protein M [Methanoregulaceae archaeon]
MSEMRNALGMTTFLFLVSLAIGVVATIANPEIGQQLLEFFKEAILWDIMDSSPLDLALKLFLNNIQACIFMFLGGASLGLVTFFIIATNGLVIGSIIEAVRQEQSVVYVAAAIIPHGIFEIPAFIISGALGFLLARALWNEWTASCDAGAYAAGLGKTFLKVVLPLIVIAAFTEAFITPQIIHFLV